MKIAAVALLGISMIASAGSMDLEGSFKYHLVDFDMDKAWFALTVGTYF